MTKRTLKRITGALAGVILLSYIALPAINSRDALGDHRLAIYWQNSSMVRSHVCVLIILFASSLVPVPESKK